MCSVCTVEIQAEDRNFLKIESVFFLPKYFRTGKVECRFMPPRKRNVSPLQKLCLGEQ